MPSGLLYFTVSVSLKKLLSAAFTLTTTAIHNNKIITSFTKGGGTPFRVTPAPPHDNVSVGGLRCTNSIRETLDKFVLGIML